MNQLHKYLFAAFAVSAASIAMPGLCSEVQAQSTIYVYPAKGQTEAQQRSDEQACHNWAVQKSGVNPNNVSVQSDDDPDVKGGRKIVLNTVGGAAVGAGVGAIAGDVSKGAAIGGAAGATRGIFKRRSAKRKARAASEGNARQQEQAMTESYRKAYSACLEGKGYSVK